MSAFRVTNCKILIHMWGDDNDRSYSLDAARSERDFYQAVVIGALASGEAARGKIVVSNPDAAIGMWGTERIANPDLTFADAWGDHWIRTGMTFNREHKEDVPEERPQCMCCDDLPDVRGRVGELKAPGHEAGSRQPGLLVRWHRFFSPERLLSHGVSVVRAARRPTGVCDKERTPAIPVRIDRSLP